MAVHAAARIPPRLGQGDGEQCDACERLILDSIVIEGFASAGGPAAQSIQHSTAFNRGLISSSV
jgi:hypothetical protein